MIDKGTENHNEHVYLDYNATTPVSEIVKEHVQDWLENWGNPSSIHWHGRGLRDGVLHGRPTGAGAAEA